MNAEQLDAYYATIDNLGRQQAARLIADATRHISLAVANLAYVNPDYVDFGGPEVDQLLAALTDLATHPLADLAITPLEA